MANPLKNSNKNPVVAVSVQSKGEVQQTGIYGYQRLDESYLLTMQEVMSKPKAQLSSIEMVTCQN